MTTESCCLCPSQKSVFERQARVLIEDAENHRSIFHNLDERNLCLYEFYYSRVIYWIRQIALTTLFLLPFFEWPSSLTLSTDVRLNLKRPRLPCGVTESIESFCILFLLVDSLILTVIFGGRSLRSNPWLLGRFFIFPIYVIDLIVSLYMECNEFYRIRRFLRPYFFISGSQMVKKLLKCLKYTLPKLLSTLFLLLFWLVCATLIALCLFYRPQQSDLPKDSGDQLALSSSFPNFYTSMYNLLILLTTANHPDVVLDVYARNRASGLFAVVFLGIGLYVFMNILTAIVYSEFRGYLMSSVQTRLTRRRAATRATFEVLRRMNDSPDSDLANSDDIIHLIMTAKFDTWKRDALRVNYVALFAESDLTAPQFMQLFRTLDQAGPLRQESRPRPVSARFAQSFQAWITSSTFSKLSIAVSFLNIVSLAVDLSERVTKSSSVGVEMRIINWCFVTFYLFEQAGLIWAYGPRSFFSEWGNVFGFTTVSLLVIAKIIELGFLVAELRGHASLLNFTLWDVVRLTNILLLTRAVRIVQLFTWTRLVAGVLSDLPSNLAPVLGILGTAYYVYALLGMNLFNGVLRFDPNSTELYECGTYQQLEYWSVNFDDFAASLILLWDLMVVNNWFVIVNAYQQAVNTWVHVYMISWWLLVPVGLLSLVTAFVIETFLHRRDLYTKAKHLIDQPREVILCQGVCTIVPHLSQNQATSTSTDSSRNTIVIDHATNSLHTDPSESLICVPPFEGSYQRQPTIINPSTLDEIFRSGLHEPSETDLLRELERHEYFRALLSSAKQTHRL